MGTECRMPRSLGLLVGIGFVLGLVVLLYLAVVPRKQVVSPSALFRKFVVDPIPQSVVQIRIDPDYWMSTRDWYVLQFDIAETDLDKVLQSRPFKETPAGRYVDGCLEWREDGQEKDPSTGAVVIRRDSLLLYAPRGHEPAPEWFMPDAWPNAQWYVFKETVQGLPHTQVLIYNSELGRAYFVEDLMD